MKFSRISKSFDDKPVLQNLNHDLRAGISVLHAGNGTGKSTLLRILSGADRTYEGEIMLNELNATRFPEEANRFRTYLPSEPQFYPRVTTFDFVRFNALARKVDESLLLERATGQFGLTPDILSKPLESLSLGQRKRAFLTVALIPGVPFWILDEPTNGLDVTYQKTLREILDSSRNEHCILIATHDLEFAESIHSQILRFRTDPQTGATTEIYPAHPEK